MNGYRSQMCIVCNEWKLLHEYKENGFVYKTCESCREPLPNITSRSVLSPYVRDSLNSNYNNRRKTTTTTNTTTPPTATAYSSDGLKKYSTITYHEIVVKDMDGDDIFADEPKTSCDKLLKEASYFQHPYGFYEVQPRIGPAPWIYERPPASSYEKRMRDQMEQDWRLGRPIPEKLTDSNNWQEYWQGDINCWL